MSTAQLLAKREALHQFINDAFTALRNELESIPDAVFHPSGVSPVAPDPGAYNRCFDARGAAIDALKTFGYSVDEIARQVDQLFGTMRQLCELVCAERWPEALQAYESAWEIALQLRTREKAISASLDAPNNPADNGDTLASNTPPTGTTPAEEGTPVDDEFAQRHGFTLDELPPKLSELSGPEAAAAFLAVLNISYPLCFSPGWRGNKTLRGLFEQTSFPADAEDAGRLLDCVDALAKAVVRCVHAHGGDAAMVNRWIAAQRDRQWDTWANAAINWKQVYEIVELAWILASDERRMPGNNQGKNIPRAEAEFLVREWLNENAKKNPASITRDAVATGTGVSAEAVSNTAAWKAFRERPDAEIQVQRADPLKLIGRAVAAAEINLIYPRPPEPLITRAMLAVPEFLISLPGYAGPNHYAIASSGLIHDLRDSKALLVAAGEWAVFGLIEAGHLEAKRIRRSAAGLEIERRLIESGQIDAKRITPFDDGGFLPCNLVYPGNLLLYPRPSLWEWWRNTTAGKIIGGTPLEANAPSTGTDKGEEGKPLTAPGKPSVDRQDDIISAILSEGTPLTRPELVETMKLRTEGKLGTHLAWMVKNGILVNIPRRGYWLADRLVPE